MGRSSSGPSRLLLGVFAAIGLAIAVFGVTVVRGWTTAPDGWVTVQGRVVALQEHPGSDGTTYAPVAEYTDAAGTTHTVVSTISSSGRPVIGDPIEVAYDPANPADARVTGGTAALAWMFVAGLGFVFVLIPGILLVGGLRGRSGREPMDGYAVRDPATGGQRFQRAGGNAVLQLVLPWIGGVGFLVFAVILVAGGLPDALFAVIPGFFGVFLLLGGIVAVGRGLDPTVAVVGADGVWLPGLGQRRWDEFADIRVETFTGPAGGGGRGGPARVSQYRRLGFVPKDPSIAAGRSLAERLTSAMGGGYYQLMWRLMGIRGVAFAPYGVHETELGAETFERLVAAVEARRAVGAETEEPAPTPWPLAGTVDDDREVPTLQVEGGGAAGMAAGAAMAFVPSRFRLRLWFAQIGFVGGLVGIVLLRSVLANLGGVAQGFALAAGAFFLVVVAMMALPAVRSARRARERGESMAGLAAFLVAGALVGVLVAGLLFG